jgi:hypothetical protein
MDLHTVALADKRRGAGCASKALVEGGFRPAFWTEGTLSVDKFVTQQALIWKDNGQGALQCAHVFLPLIACSD